MTMKKRKTEFFAKTCPHAEGSSESAFVSSLKYVQREPDTIGRVV